MISRFVPPLSPTTSPGNRNSSCFLPLTSPVALFQIVNFKYSYAKKGAIHFLAMLSTAQRRARKSRPVLQVGPGALSSFRRLMNVLAGAGEGWWSRSVSRPLQSFMTLPSPRWREAGRGRERPATHCHFPLFLRRSLEIGGQTVPMLHSAMALSFPILPLTPEITEISIKEDQTPYLVSLEAITVVECEIRGHLFRFRT